MLSQLNFSSRDDTAKPLCTGPGQVWALAAWRSNPAPDRVAGFNRSLWARLRARNSAGESADLDRR